MKIKIIILIILAINLSHPIIASTENLVASTENKAAIVDTYPADLEYIFDDPIVSGSVEPVIKDNYLQLINGELNSAVAIVTKEKIDLTRSWELDVDIDILCDNDWCADGGGVSFLKNKDKIPGENGGGFGMKGLSGYGFYTNVYRSNTNGIPRGFGLIGDIEKFQDRKEYRWPFYSSNMWNTNLKVYYDPRIEQEKGLMTFNYSISNNNESMSLEIPRTEDSVYAMLSGSTGSSTFKYAFRFNKLVYTDLEYDIVEKVYTDPECTKPVSDSNPLIENHKGFIKSIITNNSTDQRPTTIDIFSDTLSNNNDQIIESVSDVAIDGVLVDIEGAMTPNQIVSTPITLNPGESKELTYSFITPSNSNSVNIKNIYLPRGSMTVKTTTSTKPIKPHDMTISANNTVIKSSDAKKILEETNLTNVMKAKVLHADIEEIPTEVKVLEGDLSKIKAGQIGKYPIEFIYNCNNQKISLIKDLTIVADDSVITIDKKGFITYKKKVIHLSRAEKIDSNDKLIETIEAKSEYDGILVPVSIEKTNVSKIGKHRMKITMDTKDLNEKSKELIPSMNALLTVVDNDAKISNDETAYINSKNIKISSAKAKRIDNIEELKKILEVESEIDGEFSPVNISFSHDVPQGTIGNYQVAFWFDSKEIFKISEINVYEPIITGIINSKPKLLNTSNITILNSTIILIILIILVRIRNINNSSKH